MKITIAEQIKRKIAHFDLTFILIPPSLLYLIIIKYQKQEKDSNTNPNHDFKIYISDILKNAAVCSRYL